MKLNLVLFTDKVEMSILNLYHRLINTAESVSTDIYIGIYNANFEHVRSNYITAFVNLCRSKNATHGRVPHVTYVDMKRTYTYMEHFNKISEILSNKEGYTYILNGPVFVSNALISSIVNLDKDYDYVVFKQAVFDSANVYVKGYKHSLKFFYKDTLPIPDLFVWNNKLLPKLTKNCTLNIYYYWAILYNLYSIPKLKYKLINKVGVCTSTVDFNVDDAIKEMQALFQIMPNDKKLFARYWSELMYLRIKSISYKDNEDRVNSIYQLVNNIKSQLHVRLIPRTKKARSLEKILLEYRG